MRRETRIRNKAAAALATTAIVAATVLVTAAPASAGTIWGPYATNAQCQADRTQYIATGMKAMSCVKDRSGQTQMWYFYAY